MKKKRVRAGMEVAGRGVEAREREREEEKGSIYLVELDRCQAHQRKWNLGLSLSFPFPPTFWPSFSYPPFSLSFTVAASAAGLTRRSSSMLKRRPLDICIATCTRVENSTVALPSSRFFCFMRFWASLKRRFPPWWRRLQSEKHAARSI